MGKRTFVSVMLACLLVCLNVSGGVCTQSVKAAGEDTASESKAKEEKEKSSKTKPKKKPKTAEKKEPSKLAEKAVKAENLNAGGYDVVLVADNSGSMWSQQEIRDMALRSIVNLAVGSDIRVGGVYFGDRVCRELQLTSLEKEEDWKVVKDFFTLSEKDENNRGTNIGNALESARRLFENQDKYRTPIVILFSDGLNDRINGDREYKEHADRWTEEQVRLLRGSTEEETIPIYCVYLDKGDDETYLKQIVNYFDTNNSYEEERFKKVKEEEIYLLSKQFAQTFYSMQNDMKYREISLDSSGKMNFYVPSLGVRKLQLYLKNESGAEITLKGPSDDSRKSKSWQDGNDNYISVENPAEGNWTLEAKGNGAADIKGTLAYYADLSSAVELSGKKDIEGNAMKKQTYQLKAHFFDENHRELKADKAAVVKGTIFQTTENGEKVSVKLDLEAAEGGYESKKFSFQQYGTYDFQIQMYYEDFIDLNYRMEGGTVQGNAPIPHHQKGRFQASDSGHGKTFSLKLSELYTDLEGETVDIDENVTLLNEKNPVTVKVKEGFLHVTAEKAGDVKFSLKLKDASGLESDVIIEGTVVDMGVVKLRSTLAGLLIIAVILYLVVKKQNKKRLEKKLEEEKEETETYVEVLAHKYQECETALEEGKKAEQQLENTILNLRDLCADELLPEQEAEYEIEEYLSEHYVETRLKNLKDIERAVNDKKEEMEKKRRALETKWEVHSAGKIKTVLLKIEAYQKNAESAEKFLEGKREEYNKEKEQILQEIERISDKYADIMEMQDMPISCDLILTWGEFMGAKSCRYGRERITGSYSLDSVTLMSAQGRQTLGEILKKETTGIFVYGYENEEEKEIGLELRSSKPFKIRAKSFGGEGREAKRAVLLKGEEYRLILDIGTLFVEVE